MLEFMGLVGGWVDWILLTFIVKAQGGGGERGSRVVIHEGEAHLIREGNTINDFFSLLARVVSTAGLFEWVGGWVGGWVGDRLGRGTFLIGEGNAVVDWVSLLGGVARAAGLLEEWVGGWVGGWGGVVENEAV